MKTVEELKTEIQSTRTRIADLIAYQATLHYELQKVLHVPLSVYLDMLAEGFLNPDDTRTKT